MRNLRARRGRMMCRLLLPHGGAHHKAAQRARVRWPARQDWHYGKVGENMGLTMSNCPYCGRVFVRTFHNICQHCINEIEEQYQLVRDYLREHRTATITELSEETGVPVKQITKFIREGRLSLKDNPNMSYPCESCGILIREGNLCGSCRQKLAKKLNRVQESIAQSFRKPSPKPATGFEIYDKPERENQ